jgi:hypothetical protein
LLNLIDHNDLETTSGSGSNLNSVQDHSICLFQKQGEPWSVTDCFSPVQLKMSDNNCEAFQTLYTDAYQVDLAQRHGALGQAIMHSLGSIVLHRAKRGVMGSHVPLVIIAGQRLYRNKKSRKKGNPESTQHNPRETLRWVSGVRFIPVECGGQYS